MKITCQICGAQVHMMSKHIKDTHEDWTLEKYRSEYPDAPILSDEARKRLEARRAEAAASEKPGGKGEIIDSGRGFTKRPMHEVFGLGRIKAAMSARGEAVPVKVLTDEAAGEYKDMIPEKDPNYIFPIDLLKTALMGIELGIPAYLWGHAGTGKSTMWEQVCAHTNRAMIRVQHTVNTEEAHILGQRIAKDGETPFELGPLPLAMKHGMVYLADEYDFGLPSVLSVYQPVLEGKPLVIKEADPENRVIVPHPNFRIVGNGNTNGCGDETGLYQGTSLQNAANFERFGITEEVQYMPETQEKKVVAGQADIPEEDAAKLVKFANEIRTAYTAGRIGMTVSPRALIRAGKLGMLRASYRQGLSLAFCNRLTRVDREVADQFAQRIFG